MDGKEMELSCSSLDEDDSLRKRYCPLKKGFGPVSCGLCDEPNLSPIPPTDPTFTDIPPIDTAPTDATIKCKDILDFNFTINDQGKQKPCSWIDNFPFIERVKRRRECFCTRKNVKKNCKRACDECCGDNESHLFEHTENGMAVAIFCAWLRESDTMQKEYCDTKSINCPYSCGKCIQIQTMPKVSKPKEYQDNPIFRFQLSNDTNKTKPCSFIDGAETIDGTLSRCKRFCRRERT